ncbi:MAG: gamma-butyrobetaine hydroxylase-like domain-containing protein [Stenotrophobium sp.]
MKAPTPTTLKLHRASRALEIGYADGTRHDLPCEYLRVFSPSAELQGHGLIEPMLIGGKRSVNITAVEPVGQYAVRLRFDDGHDTGLYSWSVLHELVQQQAQNWSRYLERLQQMGMTRDSDVAKLGALPKKYVPPAQ